MNEKVERFAEKYGDIIGTASNGVDVAHIGHIPSTNSYLVFYPNGNMERFEEVDLLVKYRAGYTGPELKYTTPEDRKSIRDEREAAREERKIVREARIAARTPRTKRINNVKEVIWERQRGFKEINIPEPLDAFITKARKAFREAVTARHEEEIYDTAMSAFNNIINLGHFLNVVSDFTEKDIIDLKELPPEYHLYLGAHHVGLQ